MSPSAADAVTTRDPRDSIIVALDLPDVAQARALVAQIGDGAHFYKIGYRLGFSGGLAFARELVDQGSKVFLDFKLHDIGNTVAEGIAAIRELGVDLATVHAYPQTMKAAVAGRGDSALKLLAVTVLTSYDDADLAEAGYGTSVADLVARRATQAREAGIDGIVCSPQEIATVRAALGRGRLIVTPGIRPAGADAGDQKRVMTPGEAVRAGADHLVIGRPITRAADPRAAAMAIAEDIAGVM